MSNIRMRCTSIIITTATSVLQQCKTIANYIAMAVVVLFAFVPILCLFTWMIPLFVLERVIPIQFHAFILQIPLIVWCTVISTVVVCIVWGVSSFMDREKTASVQYICGELRNHASIAYGLAYLFAILVSSAFCSFVFCVSPALYLCALFWLIYETQKQSDTALKEQRLEIRQYLYQACFTLFDEIESEFTLRNKYTFGVNQRLSANLRPIKQFGFHIFSLLLSIKHITHTHPLQTNPSLIKSYIKCLQNNCASCSHQWTINYCNVPDFKSFICIAIGASVLIISHLFLFWFWIVNYAEAQVTDLRNFSQLLVYYVIEHSCIVIVFIVAGKIYLTDIMQYHAFEFLNLNHDTAGMGTLDHYTRDRERQDDILVATYRKLLYIYVEQWITAQVLRLYIKDEWLWSSLYVFLCGESGLNIVNGKELMELLDQCILNSSSCSLNHSLVIPIHEKEQDAEQRIDNTSAVDSLSEFALLFNSNFDRLPADIQCSGLEIKQLIVNYVQFCSKK